MLYHFVDSRAEGKDLHSKALAIRNGGKWRAISPARYTAQANYPGGARGHM